MKYKGWIIETVYTGYGKWIARAHKTGSIMSAGGASEAVAIELLKTMIDAE